MGGILEAEPIKVAPKPAPKAAAKRPSQRNTDLTVDRAPDRAPERRASTPVARTNWLHQQATPIGNLTIGQAVSGTVTNVLHRKVWIDIGYVKDGMFNLVDEAEAQKFKVGDLVENVKVRSIDLTKKR